MKIQSANLLRGPEVKQAPYRGPRSSGLGRRTIFRRNRSNRVLWLIYACLLGAMLSGYLLH